MLGCNCVIFVFTYLSSPLMFCCALFVTSSVRFQNNSIQNQFCNSYYIHLRRIGTEKYAVDIKIVTHSTTLATKSTGNLVFDAPARMVLRDGARHYAPWWGKGQQIVAPTLWKRFLKMLESGIILTRCNNGRFGYRTDLGEVEPCYTRLFSRGSWFPGRNHEPILHIVCERGDM